jgi:Ca-activated chloride channel family protein
MAFRWCLSVAIGAALGSATLYAQPGDSEPGVNIAPRIKPASLTASLEAPPLLRVDSSLVLVPVHVTNGLGGAVTSLKRENFRIFEDNSEQAITQFITEDAPLSIGILFDASGSMRTKMQKSAEAAEAFFKAANPGDEYFLVEFNDRAHLIVPFTTEPNDINSRIRRIRPFGRTSLLDAILLGLQQMKHARYSRKALVILSDGGDNWSRHSRHEVTNALLESDAQVYAMGIYDQDLHSLSAEERNGPGLLDDLSERSGGRHFPVDSLNDLPFISQRISRELHSQYLLGYRSSNPVCDGKYRQVKVQLTVAKSDDLRVSYRRGYYAPSE